ncbi:hypothetical protein OG250_41390 [Streptomyces sp. NBC_00487]|uniref:hypothetical protein n=1 Tax=unclassified Streptomyces TaxID=2593676 RepID=UPI002DDBAF22|nr:MULTISPECIES: hypothetical protein [unclassified Streptomyces]WRZ00739.1 hypothetical protein OG889_42310 [Streptomyces sp. NBC_00481]
MSAVDQGSDTRDELLALRDLCEDVRQAGIDIGPYPREAAELSSREDTYGVGSLRDREVKRGAAASPTEASALETVDDRFSRDPFRPDRIPRNPRRCVS